MNFGTLHVKHPDGPYSAFTINQSAFTLGRARTDKQLVLDHATVGNVHARVLIENGRLYIESLDTAYDVYVRGTRLVPGHRVSVATQEPFEVGGFTLGYTPPTTRSIIPPPSQQSPIAGGMAASTPSIDDVLGQAESEAINSGPISATGTMDAVFNPESQPSILAPDAPSATNVAPAPDAGGRVVPPPPPPNAAGPKKRRFPLWLLTLLMLVLCGLLWCVGFVMYRQICARAGDALPFCSVNLPSVPGGESTGETGGSVESQAPDDPNSVTQQFLSSAALLFIQPNADGTVSLVSQRSGASAKLLAANKDGIRILDNWQSQGRFAVAVIEDDAENLYLINARSGESVGPINPGWGAIVAGDFAPSGGLILVEAVTNNQSQFFPIDANGGIRGQLDFNP